MRFELKRLDVWSVTKISFCIHIVLGFIVGIVYAMFIGLFAGIIASLPGGEELEGAQMSFGVLIIVMPFVCAFFIGIIYTAIAVLCTLLYNLFAKLAGGIEVTLQQIPDPQPVAPQYGSYYGHQPSTYGPPPISPYAPPPPPQQPPNSDKGADL